LTSSNGHTPVTVRQLELLGHVASGMTIEQAAERCFIQPRSAYNTLSLARVRAGATTVTQLAVMAIDNGWLEKDGKAFRPAANLQSV
jgi:DNA-binding CsgD family transcriptional regulator